MLGTLIKLVRAVHYDVTGAGKHNMWTGERKSEEDWQDFDWAVCEYKGIRMQGTVAGRAHVALDQAKSLSEASGIRDNAYDRAREIADPDLRVSTMTAIKKMFDDKAKSL